MKGLIVAALVACLALAGCPGKDGGTGRPGGASADDHNFRAFSVRFHDGILPQDVGISTFVQDFALS